jgi:hypothetical protein
MNSQLQSQKKEADHLGGEKTVHKALTDQDQSR